MTLRAGAAEAVLAPGRALMLLAWRVAGRELIWAPPLAEAAARLAGDFAGSQSYAFGGAILAPWANRIPGRPVPGAPLVETQIAGRTLRLPANDGPAASLHGLILDRAMDACAAGPDRVRGHIDAGDFAGRWPSRTRLDIAWTLTEASLALEVVAANTGAETLPIGLGWHPYFALPSGRRDQAVLTLPAAARAVVGDYTRVLPTGEVVPVAGTPYDFRAGAALGARYLDDCFTDLAAPGGIARVELRDPAAGLVLRITAPAPPVTAVQVYAPPEQPFVVIEPQLALADPLGAQWRRPTGMAMLPPGGRVRYAAQVAIGGGASSR